MAEVQIKNMEHKKVLALASLVTVVPGQVVSRTLAQNDAVSLTLFAFSKGEEISTHESKGDALVTVLEGTGKITISGVGYTVESGQSLVMPAEQPHAVFALNDFKMLLTVVFPHKQEIN